MHSMRTRLFHIFLGGIFLSLFFVFSHSVFAIIAVCGPGEACGGGGGGVNTSSTSTATQTTTTSAVPTIPQASPSTYAPQTPTSLFTTQTSASSTEEIIAQYQQQLDALTKKRDELFAPNPVEISAKSLLKYLSVKVSPENPAPLETIRVTIESYISDLDKATITWSINGKIVDSGTGKRTFSFQNGPSGKITRLSVTIVTNNGERIIKELSWNPVALTILWQADTYTPPFYRGKALLTPQANIHVVALPDNSSGANALSGGKFAYVWQKDGSTVAGASGYGKNLFSFVGPKPYDKISVKVLASSVDDAIKSEKRIDLPVTQPFILFYESTPLLGVWYNHPMNSDFTLTKKEFSLSAEPYFFSNDDSDAPILKYDWSLNGAPVQNYGHTITLRNDTGQEGNSVVSLTMSGIKKTFQGAARSLSVKFTNNEESSSNRPSF